MSENQLREAYTLMKQGDKKAAAHLVQNVLREDKSNANAWWLFAHILDDEEKIVKSLERVVALNPEHLGARKKLAEMRPEYSNLMPKATAIPLAKGKISDRKQAQNKGNFVPLVVGIVIFIISFSVSFFLPYIPDLLLGNTLANVEGPSAEEVALMQLTAAMNGDYNAMRSYTCDSLEDEWENTMNDMAAEIGTYGVSWNELDINLSGLSFEETASQGMQRTLRVTGQIVMEFQGQKISVDVEEMVGFEVRMMMVVNDNRWVVCSI